MALKKALKEAVKVILDEADNNPAFAEKLEAALGIGGPQRPATKNRREARAPQPGQRGHRRTPAVFDPVALAREGEAVLRSRLAELDLEQLKDIVADYGMDSGKLVMKWKSADRIIDKIVEISNARARKGEAFL